MSKLLFNTTCLHMSSPLGVNCLFITATRMPCCPNWGGQKHTFPLISWAPSFLMPSMHPQGMFLTANATLGQSLFLTWGSLMVLIFCPTLKHFGMPSLPSLWTTWTGQAAEQVCVLFCLSLPLVSNRPGNDRTLSFHCSHVLLPQNPLPAPNPFP